MKQLITLLEKKKTKQNKLQCGDLNEITKPTQAV